MVDLTNENLEHINIDWDKIYTIDAIKKILRAYYGTIGLYTADPEIKKFRKDSNE